MRTNATSIGDLRRGLYGGDNRFRITLRHAYGEKRFPVGLEDRESAALVPVRIPLAQGV